MSIIPNLTLTIISDQLTENWNLGRRLSQVLTWNILDKFVLGRYQVSSCHLWNVRGVASYNKVYAYPTLYVFNYPSTSGKPPIVSIDKNLLFAVRKSTAYLGMSLLSCSIIPISFNRKKVRKNVYFLVRKYLLIQLHKFSCT